jgi:predicted ATP-dependent protease
MPPLAPDALPADALRRRCAPDALPFDTTADLDAARHVVGQERAVEALSFGMGMARDGYNVFALGPSGTGRRAVVRRLVRERAADEDPAGDWCYVNDFDDERTPRALAFPAGRGCTFERDLDQFIEDVKTALPAAFESEEYQTRQQMVQEDVREEQEEALEDLQRRARAEDIALMRTPQGFAFAPIRQGEVVSPEDLEAMPEEEREAVQEKIEEFQEELQRILRQVPQRQREGRRRIEALNREMAGYAIDDLLDDLKASYEDLPDVVDHLDAVRDDIVDNVEALVNASQQQQQGGGGQGQQQGGGGLQALLAQAGGGGGRQGPGQLGDAVWRRYRANVLVDHQDAEGAPVVFEDNPSYQNLVGEVEKIAQMGALITDFNLITPGALHRANGGYLVLDARKLLTQPFAWEGLKRALQAGEIVIESPREALGLISTVTLEPEAIPLDVKIVLLGEPRLYYLLTALDPDMADLFKVMADFDDRTDRDLDGDADGDADGEADGDADGDAERENAGTTRYAEMLATLIHEEDLRAFDRTGVARVIDRAARLVSDTEKLTTRRRDLRDLLCEADYHAAQDDADVVSARHVQAAIDAQIRRADRLRERIHEAIARDTLLIDTDGTAVGQVNGLSVLMQSDFAFGRPNRITARVRLGSGEIVDIERETALGGALHSKGVLILSGFVAGRYARTRPLSLNASLVFEQSYGGVDGDSASSAELYALLSAIADVPLRQGLAVTGSVNQHGVVQPIGGVNEKIEGFFDVCAQDGLTGEQGVLIPAQNVKHLMLRDDVVEAVEAGAFHVYPVATIDEGIELLTGLDAGEADADGAFPEGTFNRQVADALRRLAEQRKAYALPQNGQPTTTRDAPEPTTPEEA